MQASVHTYTSIEQLSRYTSELLTITVCDAVSNNGMCSVVLAGGTTPRLLYEYLAAPPYNEHMPWHKTHLFWGDERFVHQNHQCSNYRMARETMLSKIRIPHENIHPVYTNFKNPQKAAAAYNKGLISFFDDLGGKAAHCACFDLVLLGMGADGHTASLFPGDPSLEENKALACATTAPPEYAVRQRITMTPVALSSAHKVVFLISGGEKLRLAEKIIRDPGGLRNTYPAAYVAACAGEVLWLLAE